MNSPQTSGASTQDATPPESDLRRRFGAVDGMAILVGTVIGSGIFLVPSSVARELPYLGLIVLVWMAAGVLSLCGALTYAELGAMLPNAGGQYVFLREAFGPLTSFLYGWSAFWVIHTGTLAAVSVAFAIYLRQLIPLSPIEMRILPVGLIALLTGLNCVGVELSKWYQNVTTFLKLSVIVFLIFASLLLSHATLQQFHPLLPTTISGATFSTFGVAVMAALFAYEGWSFVTYVAGEVKDPQRNLPRILIAGTFVLILIYCLTNFSYMLNLTTAQMGASDRVAAASAEHMFGHNGASLVAATILLCVVGAANGVILTGPRIYYAMSRDGLFFRRLAQIQPRFETPVYAIVSQGLWGAILAVTGTYERLFTFVLLAAWTFYAITASAIFAYRRRSYANSTGYRVWGYPFIPLAFIVAAVLLVVNTIARSPRDSLTCFGFVLMGLPAYWYWKWKNARSEFKSVS